MTAQQIADELLREWQECDAPTAERLAEIDYQREMVCVRLSVQCPSEAATGTYDDHTPEGIQGECAK